MSRGPLCPITNLHWQKTSRAPESAHISDLAAIGRTLADALRAAGGDIREHCRIRHIIRT